MYRPINGEDRTTGWWAQHHGRARYRKGCRCDVCTAAEREYRAEYRRRRKGVTPDAGPAAGMAAARRLRAVAS